MEKKILKKGMKNSLYVILAQLIIFILGILKSLILPKILGIQEFGYWQVYSLYIGYVGIFFLGFNDGIYLKYGKYEYEQLPKKIFRSSFRIYIGMLSLFTILVNLLLIFEDDKQRHFSLVYASVNILFMGIMGVMVYIYQITNKIKVYSFFSILDKIIFIIGVLFLYQDITYQNIIYLDIMSKIVIVCAMLYYSRELFWGEKASFKEGQAEFCENIKVGLNLMFANFIGMLVIGLGRFIVEIYETIESFSAYSFAISITNLVLMFITAISLVIYPMLSRISQCKYSKYYNFINNSLSYILLGFLIIYFPIKSIVVGWFSEYSIILEYLPYLFLMLLAQGKIQLLNNTYYNILRKEKELLNINIKIVVLYIFLILPTYALNKSVSTIVIITLISMVIRWNLSEKYLLGIMNVEYKVKLDELCIMLFFIFCTKNFSNIIGCLIYLIGFMVYIVLNRKNLIYMYTKAYKILKGEE